MRVLFLLLLALSVMAAQDALLKLSKANSCLRDLVASFVRAEDCARLSDHEKSKVRGFAIQLAMQMSSCLFKEMEKDFPTECVDRPGSCRLEGDAWSTFSTFFAHLDNLCHFYWETLHHERAEKLIGQLSESSFKAEAALRENAE
jgi:hypothetical protein